MTWCASPARAYLLWLGVRSLRARGGRQAADGRGGAPSTRRALWCGLVTNVLNPKMALFTVALLPQFVDPSRGQVPAQLLVLGACFVALEIVVDGAVGLAAGRLRRVAGTPAPRSTRPGRRQRVGVRRAGCQARPDPLTAAAAARAGPGASAAPMRRLRRRSSSVGSRCSDGARAVDLQHHLLLPWIATPRHARLVAQR